MDEYEISLPCTLGVTLCATGDKLIAVKKKSQEVFPISKIQSFKFAEPGFLSNGMISFKIAVSSDLVNIGFGVNVASGGEQYFCYTKENLDKARAINDYVTGYESRQASSSAAQAVPSNTVVSVVDEIRGLKQLLDEGILTEAEFTAKKKQLLGI